MSGEDDDKQFEASPKRLEDARRKGEVPRSADLTSAAALGGFVLAVATFGPTAIRQAGDILSAMLSRADDLARAAASGGPSALAGAASGLAMAFAPFFLLPAACAIAALIAQRAVVFAPSKLAPKGSRLSPLAAAKQKFGRDGLFEFGKSSLKLVITGTVLWIFFRRTLPELLDSAAYQAGPASALLGRVLTEFLWLVLIFSTIVGCADFLWQWRAHLRRNRMSRQEIIDEHKEAEGDPHIKQHRRALAVEIATNRMLADVPKADVVIVNPTHYAVALRWQRAERSPPVLVAKGTDALAARIREAAALAGVPIRSDPPTARAIHATVEVGAPIAPEHYRAVAAAIRFAEAMRKRARDRGAR
ncbi:MAG: EscU/YscU/HrcU family type III secretion system export apparatus switch protein [Paracoccaceae bacterium]